MPGIMMLHMVGYTWVWPRIELTAGSSTSSELQVAKIKFKL
jgi:hypothetical protein